MERNREARRAAMVGSNGFNRRRYRTNNLRDSPDEDIGGLGLHETMRLRDRVKKDRDRDMIDRGTRERNLRERPSRVMSSIRRRRNERLTNGGGEIGHDETSEESVTDEDDDEAEDSNPTTTNRRHHHHQNNSSSSPHLEHRKEGFLLPNNTSATPSKTFRAPPVWRSGDELVSVSVPRKARSSSTKRTHELISSSNGGQQILRQPSDSPAMRKKLKHGVNDNGPNSKPPKAAASKPSSSNAEELEFEIAEVLYGLMSQPQGPSPSSKNEEVTRESSTTTTKDLDQTPKSEILSPLNSDKASPSTGENGSEVVGSYVISRAEAAQPPEKKSFTAVAMDNGKLLVAKKETLSSKEKDCSVVRTEGFNNEVSTSLPTSNLKMYKEEENDKEVKFEIDLMAPPPQLGSSSQREFGLELKPVLSAVNEELRPTISKDNKDGDKEEQNQEKKRKWGKEEGESLKASGRGDGLKIDLRFDLGKPERDSSDGAVVRKLPEFQAKASKEDPLPQKHGQSTSSLPLPLPLASRSKRCITHGRIAGNIYYQQQLMKMNNPFWPGAAAAAASPLFGPKPCNLNNFMPDPNLHGDKSHNLTGGSKISSQPTNTSDSSQRQQVLTQQALPPVAPSSLMGPAFIFPLNQQQAALTARSSNGKSPNTSSLSMTGGSSAQSMPLSFNYPNMGPGDAQYLAFLQSNGYAFPIPAGPPSFRGPPAQAMPMFNGSFYPQQLQQQPLPVSQPQQKLTNGSPSSQKHMQQSPEKSQNNQQKMNSKDSRVPAVNIYGQNVAFLAPSAAFSGNNQSEKRANQTMQQEGVVKTSVESSAPRGFAVSFAPSMDVPSSMAQHQSNHPIFQHSPEATQKNKNARVSIDGRSSGGELDNAKDDERKGTAGKSQIVQNAYIQHQQILNLKLQQQQFAGNQSKAPTASNRSVFSEQSNAWKGSRSQTPMNAQISFGGNHKPNTASPRKAPSSPMTAGSPTTSSASKGAGGSPRTSLYASANGKNSHGSSNMLTQQSQKSPSLLGSPHVNPSPSNKPHNPQHQVMAKNVQQAQQLFFSSPLVQVQSPSNSCGPSAYYMNQLKRPDKNQQLMQAATASSGLLTLSPSLSLANSAITMDPTKAIAAAAGNGNNGSLPSQGVFNAVQFGASGFPYSQPVVACGQSKPTEQKQPAGNENIHSWEPKKK